MSCQIISYPGSMYFGRLTDLLQFTLSLDFTELKYSCSGVFNAHCIT